MRTYASIDLVYKSMDEYGLSLFDVLAEDAKTLLGYNHSRMGVEDAKERMRNILDNLTGNVVVRLKKQLNEEKAAGGRLEKDLEFWVRCIPANTAVAGSPTATPGSDVLALMQKNMELQMEMFKMQFKLENENKPDAFAQQKALMQLKFVNLIEGLVKDKMQAGTPVQGTTPAPHTPVHTPAPISGQREATPLQQNLQKLATVDNNMRDHIAMLAKLAETNPAVYFQAVEMLKQSM